MGDVRSCYRILLGRKPDPGGLRHYAHLIRQESPSMSTIFELFIRSPEFEARLEGIYAWSARRPEAIQLLDGSSMYIAAEGDPNISGAIRRNREYEPEVSTALKSRLGLGDYFIDVGASIGYFTLLAARAVGAGGKVVAFEPGPQNQSMLLLNIATDGLAPVEVWPFALSDRKEILAYSRLASNGAVAPLAGPQSLTTGDLVQAIPMDELLAGYPRIDVIKIDVEGAEGRVLRGGEKVIRRFQPTLFFEFTPSALEEVSGTTGDELLAFLEDLGYSFTVLTGTTDGQRASSPAGSATVRDRFAEIRKRHIDVMATPSG
jgi:FkbM family methyltransferase